MKKINKKLSEQASNVPSGGATNVPSGGATNVPPGGATNVPSGRNTNTQQTVTQQTSNPPKEEPEYSYFDKDNGQWSNLMTYSDLKKELYTYAEPGKIWVWKLGGEYGENGQPASKTFLAPASKEEPKPETPWNEGYPDCAKKYEVRDYYNESKQYLGKFYEVPIYVMDQDRTRMTIIARLTTEKIGDNFKAYFDKATPSNETTGLYVCDENGNLSLSGSTGKKYQVQGEYKPVISPEQINKNITTYNRPFGLTLFTENNDLNVANITQAITKINDTIKKNYRGAAIGYFIILMNNIVKYAKSTGDETSAITIKTELLKLNQSLKTVIENIRNAGFEVDQTGYTIEEQIKNPNWTNFPNIYTQIAKAGVEQYDIFTDPPSDELTTYRKLTISEPPFGASFDLYRYEAAQGMSILTNFSDFASIDEWDKNMCQQGLDLLYAGAGHGPFIDPTTRKKTSVNLEQYLQGKIVTIKQRVCLCQRQGILKRNNNNEFKLNRLASDETDRQYRIDCSARRTEQQPIRKENNMRIKDMLKKKLTETKEIKTKVLQESNIIQTRFNFILENSAPKSKKDLSKIFEKTILEMVYLHNQGFDDKLIAESLENMFGVLTNIFKGKDEEIVKEFRTTGVNMIISSLNLDENQRMRMYLDKSLKSTDTQDVPKLLTDPKFLADKLAQASIDSYMEDLSEDMGGEFMNAVHSSIKDVMKSSDLKDKIQNRITGITRPIIDRVNKKFEDQLQSVKSSLVSKKDIQA